MDEKQELLRFLSKFETLTAEEIQVLTDTIVVKSFKKGEIIIQEGQVYGHCFFVLKGCLRQFVVIDGVEKTTEFYTEEQAIVTFMDQATQKANSNVSCLEDSLLIMGEVNSEEEMYQKVPKLEKILRCMIEKDLHKSQAALSNFIVSTPEARYQNLLSTRPDLFQRAPQHQIASYIGVTPESLSRIRKRLSVA